MHMVDESIELDVPVHAAHQEWLSSRSPPCS
jgi:hypothetical protein